MVWLTPQIVLALHQGYSLQRVRLFIRHEVQYVGGGLGVICMVLGKGCLCAPVCLSVSV